MSETAGRELFCILEMTSRDKPIESPQVWKQLVNPAVFEYQKDDGSSSRVIEILLVAETRKEVSVKSSIFILIILLII